MTSVEANEIASDAHRNDFSWDQLEEDEHGRLRASVCLVTCLACDTADGRDMCLVRRGV